MGDRIVVCYTRTDVPNQVFSRVIRHGVLGPATGIGIAKDREYRLRDYSLRTESMVLYGEGDRIWFVNTQSPGTLYELRLADVASV